MIIFKSTKDRFSLSLVKQSLMLVQTYTNLISYILILHEFLKLLHRNVHFHKGICKTRYHPQSPKTTPKIEADTTGR